MNELEHQWGIRAPEELRVPRMDEALPGQETDAWLKESTRMVVGRLRGLAENQRRIRYFGFETTHEPIER